MTRNGDSNQFSGIPDETTSRTQNRDAQVLPQVDSHMVNQENLQRLTENMYDVIVQIGPNGTVHYASPSHKWVLGLKPEEMLGRFIFERLHPDDFARVLAIFSKAVAEKQKSDPFTLRYQHADGHYVWMECCGNLLLDEKGEFAGAVLSSRDVSDRIEIESKLQESEQLYRLLAENARDVIWTMDLNFRMTYVSPSVQDLCGYSIQETLLQTITDRLTADSAEVLFKSLTDMIADLAVQNPEYVRDIYRTLDLVVRRKDGSTVWIEMQMKFLLNEADKPTGILGVTRDITDRRSVTNELRRLNIRLEERVRERTADLLAEVAERKRVEKALRDSEARYRAVLQQSLEAIYIFDTDSHQILEANPAFLDLLGYTAEEIAHLTLYDIVMEEKSSIAYFHQKLLNGEGIKIGERRWRRKDGTTVEVEVTANRIQQGERNIVFVVARDITERKRAEMILRESEERYAIAVRGANDGLWDWNLRTNEIYFSPRWSSMLGVEENVIGKEPEEWFKRVHPQDLSQLQTAINLHISGNTPFLECEYRIQHSNKDFLWVLSRGLAMRDADGKAYRMAGSQTDIADRKRAEERLAYDALHDVLTGLPNRILFIDRLGQRLEHAKRHPDDLFAVLFIDLDRFKVINDSLGHSVGDEFLTNTAQRLLSCLRPEDTISRLGGDEFAVLLNEVKEESDTVRVVERIQSRLESTSMLESVDRSSTASIGIALYNNKYTEPLEMLRDADAAMYRAKALGGGRCQLFDKTMYENALLLLQMEADLKRAVENREWRVYYQPIISLESGRITGVEALVRWMHPTRGIVSPLDFIPIAEETGLILQIGQYVLRTACVQAKTWQDSGHVELWVSVNISGRQFQEKNLVKLVEQTLTETGLPSEGLRLEITESVAMKDLAHSISILTELNKLGVNISLDDFGNGYSSLSYLKQFPLKVLKIDRSFIQDNGIDKNGEAITSAIIFMGQTLNLEVVAEGVETQEQLNFLRSQFCNEVQGFLFGQPMSAEEITKLLSDGKNFLKP
jgi:diguanylate cyclase (GGDEF)-like protein/PAS domain S-box-containing protein